MKQRSGYSKISLALLAESAPTRWTIIQKDVVTFAASLFLVVQCLFSNVVHVTKAPLLDRCFEVPCKF